MFRYVFRLCRGEENVFLYDENKKYFLTVQDHYDQDFVVIILIQKMSRISVKVI